MDSKTLLTVWSFCLCVAVALTLLWLDVHDRGALEQEAAPLQGDSVVRAALAPPTELAPAAVDTAPEPLPEQPPEPVPQGQP